MKVCFASYQSLMMLRGGPRTQIFQTKLELEKLGVRVSLFDPWKEFHAKDFDLVHIFSANMGTYHLARVLHLSGVPTVVTPIFLTRHSNRYVRSIVSADKVIRRYIRGHWTDFGMIAEMCRWAGAVLPNTADEAALVEEGFGVPRERISIVPNGVERRFAKANPALFRRKMGIERFVLSVGHIGPERKNVRRLLHALEGVNHQAVVIGRIEHSAEAEECLALARRNPRVIVLDSLPHDSPLLASAYAACDAFVLPSLFETPGIAALEAALAGARVVITDRGGTKDYFGEQADYVDPYSVESIRGGIVTALGKPRTPALRRHIEKNFLWSGVARKTKAAYERALSSPSR